MLKLKTNRGNLPHLHVEAAQQQEMTGLDSSQSLHRRQSRPRKRNKSLEHICLELQTNKTKSCIEHSSLKFSQGASVAILMKG